MIHLKSILFLFLILVALSSESIAQEKLYDVKVSQAANNAFSNNKPENNIKAGRSSNIDVNKFIYVVDTLPLPFFDDFSTNRIKTLDASINDPNVSLKINYNFKVNDQAPITLDYLRDTTKFIRKTMNGEELSFPNPVLYITFFEDGVPVDADTGWTNLITRFDESTGLVKYDTLTPDVSLTNFPDTFYKVADDKSLWLAPRDSLDTLKSAPLINNTYAKNQVTQGVASFDGTDRRGFPYDISSETSYGEADMLISKPLALDSNMSNVLLSFFFQAGGNGNMPEEEDSLILEFFDVQDSLWRSVWSGKAPSEEDTLFSDQVFIPISGRAYLRSGFQFRFRNYATLSGSMDHWHIDYVRVGANRDSTREDTINDIAFISGIQSFMEGYTMVPYSHYLSDPSYFEVASVSTVLTNLGSEEANILNLRYDLFDPAGNLFYSEPTADPNVSPFTVRRTPYPVSQNSLFPDLNTEMADFEIQSRYTATGIGNEHRINDTIRTSQSFRNYYAYDDGSAEKAYGLTGAGLKLAYEFKTPVGDTLHAVYFNFPQVLHDDNEDLDIEIIVWDDLETEPIYVAQQLVEPQYTYGNQFFRIKLDNPLYVNGRFYIGFRQIEATKVYIGFDVNTNSRERINYQINDEWYTSSFNGSLLIRPHFGTKDLLGSKEIQSTNSMQSLRVYPNPAGNLVNLEAGNSGFKNVELYDLSGRLIKTYSAGMLQTIDVVQIPNGIYILKATTLSNKSLTQKLIINH